MGHFGIWSYELGVMATGPLGGNQMSGCCGIGNSMSFAIIPLVPYCHDAA